MCKIEIDYSQNKSNIQRNLANDQNYLLKSY